MKRLPITRGFWTARICETEQYRRENKQKPNRPLVWLLGQPELSKDEKLQKRY